MYLSFFLYNEPGTDLCVDSQLVLKGTKNLYLIDVRNWDESQNWI